MVVPGGGLAKVKRAVRTSIPPYWHGLGSCRSGAYFGDCTRAVLSQEVRSQCGRSGECRLLHLPCVQHLHLGTFQWRVCPRQHRLVRPMFFLPDSGLESIAHIDLGVDSPARHTAIFMQTEEGFHSIFMSVVGLFVAFHAQEYRWYFLGLRLVMLVCEELKKT